ncbi:carbon-phosphorus lyase complex subunit PhnI [Halobacillus karajensis]|uniref:Alpha-D-ribose 1-methylphosphonate 5-triphosphate synthase subunit PhnI n=1 Tax=Halobacillus karajensis TaxID=195088 RepID=A0A024P4C7_9BACI|nr:carbon-phosphorus lyase complex subunit PhnI [Halobacillus karajensis]CDQ20820.1 Alpha-D-ribose 1-methylphosphonate 5-triphosphate synthase subunit PhnI [Halobacillus karajensis]CDQ23710.1 Alpha-D-ribose 1-methylphosphonate 5-triphosphate synthase subunit PhnI [Halobacillus karajensis]CDQ27188.1 Alpha-D-ribose 1-methylphosphonate 5-triphosphate synthase subunit PhnI [Halobacillus karajensis]
MGYVAVKGGTAAIEASIKRLKYERLKDEEIIEVNTILSTMRTMVDQVMSESSLYSPFLAALAIKQAEGSMEEAVFLMRAHRSTLPRLYYSQIVESESMLVERRISASFKDIPGGQLLGATYDYTHRLLDFHLTEENAEENEQWLRDYKNELQTVEGSEDVQYFPKVVDYLREEGLFETYELDNTLPKDITKESLQFPASRSERLQVLTRGQTGAVTSLGYASLRGYGQVHPTVGEVRVGAIPIYVEHPNELETDEEDHFYIGDIKATEVESFVPVSMKNDKGGEELEFEIGYGVCYGQNETKAIAMSTLDQCLEHPESDFPTHDEEFVLLHIDSVESTGFISHLKLPHYVTFQSKLDSIRQVKKGVQKDAN